MWLEKVIAATDDSVSWLVVSYGKPRTTRSNVRMLALPAVNYAGLGRLMSRRPWWLLNLLYYVPLSPLAWVAGAVTRPTVLVANGLMAALVLLPLTVTGARLVLAYHGYAGHMNQRIRSVLRRLLSRCDAAFVNSPTSFDDLAGILDPRKISLVPHPADDVFFQAPLTRPAKDGLVVLFVGRLDEEKFAQCLRVCRTLGDEGEVELWAVGGGSIESQLDAPGCRRFGYIESRADLAAIYAAADIVWAPADATYLSLPGVEALASGCPVIVSDVPAVDARAEAGERIPKDLIPSDIGFVVSGTDDGEAMAVLRSLCRSGVPREMREGSRRYALQHHGPENIELVTDLLFPRDIREA